MNLKTSKLAKKKPLNLSGIAATLLIAVLTAANVWQMNDRDRDLSHELFDLARENYIQGKYDVCLYALTRAHDFVSPSDEAKQLENFCMQGKELVKREENLKAAVERKLADERPSCKLSR